MLIIKFSDGELVYDVDWNTLPNKEIRYMDYKMGNKTIRLIGYERYLRLKVMIHGVNSPIHGVGRIILVGQRGEICNRVTVDFMTKQCQKEVVPIEEVFNGKPIADNFWRKGQYLPEAKCLMLDN